MRTPPDERRDAAVTDSKARADQPERRCILTGAHGPRQQLIRLVAGPDGAVWPDLSARLPGRGAWIMADQEIVRHAAANGRLRTALARAWRSTPPEVPADLAERIAAGLAQRALQRLGLEMRAGYLVWGSERLAEWARGGRIHLLLHAADAAADGAGRLDQAFRAGGGAMDRVLWLPCERLALSSALGRDNMVHVGVADPRAAARIRADVARWSGFLLRTQADGRSGAQASLLSVAMVPRTRGPVEPPSQAMTVDDDGQPMAGTTNEGRE